MERSALHLAKLSSMALGAALLSACGHGWPDRAGHVATGYLSHQLCSAVFVAGMEPQRYFREALAPAGGLAAGLLKHTVDRDRGEVRASMAGLAESRALYRPPYGCVNATGSSAPLTLMLAAPPATASIAPPLLPDIAGPAVVEPALPALRDALDRAFAEPAQPPHRWTQAVVVAHRGRVIAERYAPGVGVDTPLTGWSMTKSVLNAMVGILVRDGRLRADAPAPVGAWAAPDDPRHTITIDQLMRMTAGLDMGQSLTAGINDMIDPAAQMVFVDADSAAVAQAAAPKAPPGTVWNYTNANTQILSRIVADHVGGTPPATLAFVRRELFDKLGMRHATLEFDAAGTPLGSSHLWAPARDWARFGLLYLNDGMVGGERVLPAGWADYSATPTPSADAFGYGAGFWTNRGEGSAARYRVAHGMPADSFMARGSNGQAVVIVPSLQLVIARLGNSWTPRGDTDALLRLVGDVTAALPRP